MKAYIITDSTNYEPRALTAGSCLRKKGYETEYIFSDFNHALKKKGRAAVHGETYIDAGSYKKNISPARLMYHRRFAGKVYDYLNGKEDVSLLYVMLPGNSLAPAAVRLKREKGCGLIFDLIDLWPESLPLRGFAKTPPATYWKALRDNYINDADHIITECRLYRSELDLDTDKTSTMYWVKQEKTRPVPHVYASGPYDSMYIKTGQHEICRGPEKEEGLEKAEPVKSGMGAERGEPVEGGAQAKEKEPVPGKACSGEKESSVRAAGPEMKESPAFGDMLRNSSDVINIAYIGSINNIIDIPAITGVLRALSEKCRIVLHIIGDGENRGTFLQALADAGIPYEYYGAIYEEERKEEILRACSWGLNIMKKSVRVGLTMKSIDYMANGLKLINNIPGDTWDIVEKHGFGVNISSDYAEAAGLMASYRGADAADIYDFYTEHFTMAAAERILNEIL